MLRALENLGIRQVYGLRYFGQGSLSHDVFIKYIRHSALAEGYLNASLNFAQAARNKFSYIQKDEDKFVILKKM